jgi:hypothetical protein
LQHHETAEPKKESLNLGKIRRFLNDWLVEKQKRTSSKSHSVELETAPVEELLVELMFGWS